MTNTLYTWVMSPTCTSVHLAQAALGIDLKREYVNIWKGEQFSLTFLKINPQHKVPTLVDDNGVVMWDSHVINIYLCSKYGNKSLYPKDLVKRSLVHQMLFYDASVVFPLGQKLAIACVKGKIPSAKDSKEVCAVFDVLEDILKNREWVAGDKVTLADFSLIPNVTGLNVLIPGILQHPNVQRWIRNAEKWPFYNENVKFIDSFVKFR